MSKLVKKIQYSGTITCLSGLHIGSTNSQLGIGGVDKYVVRNPIDNMPYIPGSSLKGKMRSLVELANGETDREGGPSANEGHRSVKLFGSTSRASRLIVRDAELMNVEQLTGNTDLLYTESKTEVTINRLTGTAAKAGPRTIERVPAGAKFSMSMVLNIFEGDDEQALKATVLQALKLLEDDYLGGNGSRGYGQVKIELAATEERLTNDYGK